MYETSQIYYVLQTIFRYITPKNIKISIQWMVTSKMEAGKNDPDSSLDWDCHIYFLICYAKVHEFYRWQSYNNNFFFLLFCAKMRFVS